MSSSIRRCSLFLTLLLASIALGQSKIPPAPPAAKRPVTDEYHRQKVVDDYRWLENWDDPEVKHWSAAENARTRVYLDSLHSRPAIWERLQQLMTASTVRYNDLIYRSGVLFATKMQPPKQQPLLIAMNSADDPSSEKVIVDPNTIAGNGSSEFDFCVPSLDGKLVAVSLSENGSEEGSAHVFEVASGKELPDRVPRVNFATAGGSIAWNADGTGFYYTRYPQGNERPAKDMDFYQQVYFHKLGTDASSDTYMIGKDFPRIAEIQLHTSNDGKWLLVQVANGDGGQFEHYVMDSSSGKWTQVTHFEDGIVGAVLGSPGDESLYLLSRRDAPRGKILKLALAKAQLSKALIVVPQSPGVGKEESARASITGFLPTPSRLYVEDVIGGPSRVRVFDHDGRQVQTLPEPPISAIGDLVHANGDNVLFRMSTYLESPAWYKLNAKTGQSEKTALVESSQVKFDDAEVVREFAHSKDGTRVPLNIIRCKGTKLDGTNPTILNGYGGYGVNLGPGFVGANTRLWLDAGGIFVIANLRGGGEYGEEWHKAGNLTHKQNVFDDFIAAAEHLIQRKYTSPQHLAILGGSNDGLLMGAAFTQRPELFRAAVSYVGIYDMLGVELDPNGAFNVTEFGTVKDPEQFKALYGYSPYHHVRDRTKYPAILFLTGENDHRVNPMQSRKMTARLQAANASEHPVLLRTTASAGHGIGTALSERIEQSADVYSFLFDQLGIQYPPAK